MCAAAFTASVTESALTGPGAGGFMLAAMPGAEPVLLDFFVAAPGLAGGPRLTESDLDSFAVPFGGAEQTFHIGPASVAVPGQLPGLIAAHDRFGRLPLADLIAPAVRLARSGVRVSAEAAFLYAILGDMLTHTAASRRIYAPDGRLLAAGDLMRMPRLAATLEGVADDPPAALAALDAAVVAGLGPSGRIAAEDLAAYRVIERPPLRVSFRGDEVLTNPPPSWGGVLIAAALERLSATPSPVDAPGRARALVDAGVTANRLRGPRFAEMLDDPETVRRMISGAGRGPAGTTHISATDRDGGAASMSTSNGAGSGVVAGETGVLLNNMMGEQDLNPDGFGRIAPGARPPSMMSPTIVLRAGEPVLAVGSAGSNRIRSAILGVMSNLIDAGMSPAAAVSAPRLHPEAGGVDIEGGVANEVINALEDAGHELRRWDTTSLFFGGAAVAGSVSGELSAAGDPRRGGGAWGVTDSGEMIPL